MDRFVIIAPLSALSKRTRLFKLSTFLNKTFPQIKISHFAWERIKGEAVENNLEFVIDKKIIYSGGGYGGTKIKFMYFVWMIKVFFNSLIYLKKKDTVWALGFESAFPCMLASKIIGFRVYFDDADRFSMIFKFPNVIQKLIEYMEKLTSKQVYMHVVPGLERYNFDSNKFFVLKNMPSKSEIIKAKQLYQPTEYIKSNIVINVNGWLGNGRGMHVILEIAECYPHDVAIVMAGKLDCDDAIKLCSLKNVQYLGEVNNAQALASYIGCDFVFTYYNPVMEINNYAESNKWGDAIKIGVGVIVNSEVKTANYLRENGAAISVPYLETVSLKNEINTIIKNKTVNSYKQNALTLSDKFGYFEEQFLNIFKYETKQN